MDITITKSYETQPFKPSDYETLNRFNQFRKELKESSSNSLFYSQNMKAYDLLTQLTDKMTSQLYPFKRNTPDPTAWERFKHLDDILTGDEWNELDSNLANEYHKEHG